MTVVNVVNVDTASLVSARRQILSYCRNQRRPACCTSGAFFGNTAPREIRLRGLLKCKGTGYLSKEHRDDAGQGHGTGATKASNLASRAARS